MKKILLLICGCSCLLLGGIGVFMPILPTTPFVLMASGCFASCNEKIHNKLLKSRLFGEFINNYKNKTGVRKVVKIRALVFLWLTLITSALISKSNHMYVLLSVIGILVSLHICCIKTKK